MSKHNVWFKKLLDPKVTEKVPNAKQLAFLRAVAGRCIQEHNETQKVMQASSGRSRSSSQTVPSEPANFALLAPPGTGKTAAIKMCCAYFEEVLGWSPGDEFQCLASQNRMSARIHGLTIHSWAEVPIMEDATGQRGPKRNKKTGGAEMYNKAAGKRWLVIIR